MLKHKIKISPSNFDQSINLYLNTNTSLSGLSEDIENLVTDKSDENINNGVDGEAVRFQPVTGTSYTMTAFFYRNSTSSYVSNVAPNEFTSGDITSQSFLKSFYIIEVYDTPLENTQKLLYNGYLNGFNFRGYSSSGYVWNNTYEYVDIHIPNSLLAAQTGTSIVFYLKIAFYSAKTGIVYPFNKTQTPLSEQQQYHAITANTLTMYYQMPVLFTFYENINTNYVNVVNENTDSLPIQDQTFPIGNTFTVDGDYITN